jgi:flagellar hook-associated protein 3
MRITPSIIYEQLIQSLTSTMSEYAKLNEQLSTNKKLLAPSDDPGGMMRAIDYQIRISQNDQYGKNIDFAKSQLSFTSTTLQSAQSTLSQLQAIANRAIIGAATLDPNIQANNAQLTASLRDTLFDLSNVQYGGQYLFSGFKSDTKAYAAGTYDYQGDNGLVNVPVDKGVSVAVNVPGSSAFSYTIGPVGATYSKQITGGLIAHYTQNTGTTVLVEIRQADDVSRPEDDTFSFSNMMQMGDLLSSSISSNNAARISSLIEPFSKAQTQMQTSISDVTQRVSMIGNQSNWLSQSTDTLHAALSPIQDANTAEVIAKLQLMNTTLTAIETSASKIMTQSLLDFLK